MLKNNNVKQQLIHIFKKKKKERNEKNQHLILNNKDLCLRILQNIIIIVISLF